LVPLFGGPTKAPSNNRERGGALALGGHRLMMQRNNQPRVGANDRLESGEEARWSGSAGWDVLASFGVSNGATKKIKIKHTAVF
jgi:hypothetical protein